MSLPGAESLTTVITPSQEERVAQLLRVQDFNVSSDGIGAGEDQTGGVTSPRSALRYSS